MPTTKIKKFKSKSSFKMKKKLSKSKSKSKNKNRKTKSLSRKRNYRRKNKLIGGSETALNNEKKMSFANVARNAMAVGQGHCYPITDKRFKDYKTFTPELSETLFKNCSQEYKKFLEGLLRVDLNNIENKNKLSILLDIMTEEKDITEVGNNISKGKQNWQHITQKVIDELKEKLNFLNLLNYCLWLFDLLKIQNNTSKQIIQKINNTKRFVSLNLDRKINKTDINIKKIVDYQMTIYKICLILINIINSQKEINNTINDSKLMTPLNNQLELLKTQSISLELISFIDFTDKTGGGVKKYYKALAATVGGILFGVVATAACLTGILIFLFGLAFESDKIIGFAIRIFGWTAETSVAIFNVISDVFKTMPPNVPHLYLDPPPPPPNRTRPPMYLPPTPNMRPYP